MRFGYFVTKKPTTLETRVSEGECPAGSEAAREAIRRVQESNKVAKPYYENSNTRQERKPLAERKPDPVESYHNCATCDTQIPVRKKYCEPCRKKSKRKGTCSKCGGPCWKQHFGAICQTCISAAAAPRRHCAEPDCRTTIMNTSTYCIRHAAKHRHKQD